MTNPPEKPLMISLRDVSCRFLQGKRAVNALQNVTLDIKAGEFFGLLGPSGSGKTTCLRVMAGFMPPDAGQVCLNGEDVTHLPANKRKVNTVFQDYALFPHLTVGENIGYGLMVRGIKPEARQKSIDEILRLVRLSALIDRKPAELSRGQQQRVALARALVLQPLVLLLDEPLSTLDLKLREQMQHELKTLHHATGVTFVFVTHDQNEAFSLCDRIGVFHDGQLVQVASPYELYHRPNSEFVANFVGLCNFINYRQADGQVKRYIIRPENCQMGAAAGAQITGIVREVQYCGANYRLVLDTTGCEKESLAEIGHVEGKRSLLQLNTATPMAIGSKVHVHWPENILHHLPQANFV